MLFQQDRSEPSGWKYTRHPHPTRPLGTARLPMILPCLRGVESRICNMSWDNFRDTHISWPPVLADVLQNVGKLTIFYNYYLFWHTDLKKNLSLYVWSKYVYINNISIYVLLISINWNIPAISKKKFFFRNVLFATFIFLCQVCPIHTTKLFLNSIVLNRKILILFNVTIQVI